jgi:HAD superfamily hydrolase (TIGR01484 family)
MTSKVFVFDLDGTLAESKQPIPCAIVVMLANLTKQYPVAILTGGTLNQVQAQVINKLMDDTPLSVYACSGTTYQLPDSEPVTLEIPLTDREYLATVLKEIATIYGYWCDNPIGEIIEDRISQITFSALGQHAYPEQKKMWDADGKKRNHIIKHLQPYLGDYVAHIGGTTSIDITHKNHNKQTGIELIAKHYGISTKQITFIGDDLQPGGNDYPVTLTEATCIPTRNWLHTIQIVNNLTYE